MKACIDKQCKRIGIKLDLDEFPVNRHNKSGLHSYCKECSLRRCNEYRAKTKPKRDALRAKIEAQRLARREEARRQKLSIKERVYREIASGNGTREGIATVTEFHEDAVSDAVAELWDQNYVGVEGERFYARPRAA